MKVNHALQAIVQWIVLLPVVLFAYGVAWLDRRVGLPLLFPRNTDELARKQQWCTRLLKECGALPEGAEVRRYQVTALSQERIFRSNAGFVELTYDDRGEERTLACFAKFAPVSGSVWNRVIFNLQLNHLKEARWNACFVKDGESLPAPRVYCAKVSALTGNLCLITERMDGCVEFLEGESDEGFFAPSDPTTTNLTLVVDGMATLHGRFWKERSKRMKNVLPIFDGTVYWFESLVVFTWSAAARRLLVRSWTRMNEFQTVLHGDARIGNMMFPAAPERGRFVFIDWQAVRKGRGAFDLAYFLVLSLSTERRTDVEQQVIADYHRRLLAEGVTDYSKDELDEDYGHACICVLVLLSLPLLSGEASVEGAGARRFAWGMNIWRERLKAKFAAFDYRWMASRYGVTEQEGRDAIAEMLAVIERRLERIVGQAPPPSLAA